MFPVDFEKNLTRSLYKHFKIKVGNFPVGLEGQYNPDQRDQMSLRINEVTADNSTEDLVQLTLELNLLIQVAVTDASAYSVEDALQIGRSAFTKCIDKTLNIFSRVSIVI